VKLPPNVSKETFQQALADFARVVGAEWVFSSDEDVALYRDAYSPAWDTPGELVPSAAVAPQSTEEVQAVVRIANRYKIPLFPISTGKNLGYGGSSPNLSGSVIVDLKRMNRIIEVDDRRHFCIVEPGVSYFDLYQYITERGLKLFMDIPDPGWGSLVGNALDHGVGYTFMLHRDHFGSHAGMEVVLPDGEVMRTGMGAVPNSKSFAENRYGFGAYVDGLFAQANFGIVTRMGFWLMPLPEYYLSCKVKVPKYRDIIPLVDGLNLIEDQGLMGYPRIMSSMDISSMMFEPTLNPPTPELMKLLTSQEDISASQYEEFARKRGREYWSVTLTYYGPQATCEANWAYTQRVFKDIPEVSFSVEEAYALPLSNEQRDKMRHKVTLGIPSMEIFAIGARSQIFPNPSDGHLWFAPIIPRSGEAIIEAHDVFIEETKKYKFPLAPIRRVSPPQAWHLRSFVMLFPFFTSRSDDRGNAFIRSVFPQIVQMAAEHGWTEYRAAPLFQDLVASTYSFNNNRLRHFQEALKDAVDPNGIIAPGRGGIWPKPYREFRR